ncbi:uncharacterized protein LOC131968130 [Centropristis striata]|uniref:uncharacterized protein LOC131968130 n=1 Tax=Centropristis striata TaxID=184440 RepID=UPI0027E1CCC8|nr:uncharacterized protein LOC131968130 [Centropristis striata]
MWSCWQFFSCSSLTRKAGVELRASMFLYMFIFMFLYMFIFMFLYMFILMAYHSSRWIPRSQRIKFQIVNGVFAAVVLVPQLYVLGRPRSWRYCKQPLLNNLSASIASSFIASGFSVIFTLIDPVPQSLWASYHMFGLLTCVQGLCTVILTLSAAACAKTTTELYYMSLILTVASIFSTGEVFFLN